MEAFKAATNGMLDSNMSGCVRAAAAFVASVALTTFAGCDGHQRVPRDSQVVDGMAIYLGVMPAELVQGHSVTKGHPKAMHGGTPPSVGSHHIVVALFDAGTGARITDASIHAEVGDRSKAHEPARLLEPMQIADTTTYGNFFAMQDQNAWRIHLTIERPNIAHKTEADFRYEHAVGH